MAVALERSGRGHLLLSDKCAMPSGIFTQFDEQKPNNKCSTHTHSGNELADKSVLYPSETVPTTLVRPNYVYSLVWFNLCRAAFCSSSKACVFCSLYLVQIQPTLVNGQMAIVRYFEERHFYCCRWTGGRCTTDYKVFSLFYCYNLKLGLSLFSLNMKRWRRKECQNCLRHSRRPRTLIPHTFHRLSLGHSRSVHLNTTTSAKKFACASHTTGVGPNQSHFSSA